MFRSFAKLDLASLALRLALAAIFISLGLTKLNAGWGTSWEHSPAQFSSGLQGLIAWVEFLAGVGMLVGLLTRVSALALLAIMIGHVWWLNFHPDFVANWHERSQEFFNAAPVAWPYAFAVAGMCLALLVLGGGLFSVDYFLWGYREHRVEPAPRQDGVVTAPAVPARGWNFRHITYLFRPRGQGGLRT